jgi:hypothetical protein
VSPLPADTLIAPPLPPVAAPDAIVTAPVSPTLDVPEENLNAPLTPAAPEFIVYSVSAPLLVAKP